MILGSLWALIPAGVTFVLFIIRIILEDRTLQNELKGYKEYAGRVRYRLIPGIF
jgi:protein-S-isoprenylcysteine O-methyltransferase Ste14